MTRVLIGIDGSIASRAAIRWGAERVRSEGTEAEITLRFVVDDEWGTIGMSALAELQASAGSIAQRELGFARRHAGAVPVHAETSIGAPMLVLASASQDYDLVVVGTHKVGVFHGLALGSRSLQLAAMSPVPVAIVPAPSAAARHGIIMGVGGEAGEDTVVEAAVHESNRTGEPLVLVRSSEHSTAAGRSVLNHAIRVAEVLAPRGGLSERLSSALPGETLAVSSATAVLTVVGRPTEVGAHGYRVLGRTTADLLLNLRGPVLVVPFQSSHVPAAEHVLSAQEASSEEGNDHAITGAL